MKKEKAIEIIGSVKEKRTADYIQEVLDKILSKVESQEVFDYNDMMVYIQTFESGKLGGKYMYVNKALRFLKSEFRDENKRVNKENKKFLEKIRLERPEQKINKVLSFEKNEYGFYNVLVDMESMFFDTKILHTHVNLPYPLSSYEKLSNNEQLKWRSSNTF